MSTSTQLKEQGLEHFHAGQFEAAIAAFTQARSAFLAEGNRAQAAECANDLGVAARQAARFEEAETAFGEARKLFEELNDTKSLGQVIGNLAALAESRNQNDSAAQFYKQAIQLFDEQGETDLVAETWRALSRLRMKQGKWFQALGAYDAGLEGVKRLTPTQLLLRRLLKISRRLIGNQ